MMFTKARRRPAILERNSQRRHRPDYVLVLLSTILLVIGLIVVYSISPALVAQQNVGDNYYVTKQLTAVGLGIITFLIAANIPVSHWRRLQKPLIIAALLSSAAVQLFGQEINGASRWVQIGGLSFQAVELIKFALLVWLAGFLTDRLKEGEIGSFDKMFKPILIVLAICGVIVAFLQSDLGSTGVIAAVIGAMCFVAGLPLKRVMLFVGIIAIGTFLAISSSSYRRQRLATFLQPERDCLGSGYQACQALIAIGSGGMFGRGLGGSVQAYGYQPESANDSIFAIYAEMFGFIGVTVLLGLFVALFARLKHTMERAPDTYSRLLLTGILAWLSTQAVINMGAMIGLLPLKGITLPFISYGGTSLIFVTAAVGLAFNISRYTTYGVNETEIEGQAGQSLPGKRYTTVRYSASSRPREAS